LEEEEEEVGIEVVEEVVVEDDRKSRPEVVRRQASRLTRSRSKIKHQEQGIM
jgi:hypothetical protein